LRTIPAIGHVTALTWVLEVGEVERFHSVKQVISQDSDVCRCPLLFYEGTFSAIDGQKVRCQLAGNGDRSLIAMPFPR
jgi:hypothetical protein